MPRNALPITKRCKSVGIYASSSSNTVVASAKPLLPKYFSPLSHNILSLLTSITSHRIMASSIYTRILQRSLGMNDVAILLGTSMFTVFSQALLFPSTITPKLDFRVVSHGWNSPLTETKVRFGTVLRSVLLALNPIGRIKWNYFQHVDLGFQRVLVIIATHLTRCSIRSDGMVPRHFEDCYIVEETQGPA